MLIDKTKGRTAMTNTVAPKEDFQEFYNKYLTTGLKSEIKRIVEDVQDGYFMTKADLQAWSRDYDIISKAVNEIVEQHKEESGRNILKAILLNMPEQYKLNNRATVEQVDNGECDVLDYEYNDIIITVGLWNSAHPQADVTDIHVMPDVECFAKHHADSNYLLIGSIRQALKQV